MSFREIKNLRKLNAKAKPYAKKVAVNYMNTTEETPSTLHYNSGRVRSGQEHLAKLLTSERRRSFFFPHRKQLLQLRNDVTGSEGQTQTGS